MTDQSIPVQAAAYPTPWTRACAIFGCLAALLTWSMWGAVASMAATWWNDVTYNHGMLVPAISLYLLWAGRDALRALAPRPEPLALPALLLCIGGWLLGRAAEAQVVEQAAFVGALIALAVVVFGRRAARAAWFPLAFLVFMVPAGDVLIAPLQDFTAAFSVQLLRLVGIPTYVEGVLIYIPSGAFEVAEACAGLRFLIANVVVAALFSYLVYDRAWKRAAFLMTGIALPILANGLRAFGIMVLAHATDHQIAAGADHIIYGWGFFSAVMLALLWIGNRFADRPVGLPALTLPRRADRPGAGITAGPAARWTTLAAAAAMILAGPAYASRVMGEPGTAPRRALTAPVAAAPWVPTGHAADWEPHFVGPDRTLRAAWSAGAERAEMALAWYDWQRQGAEAVNDGNRFADDTVWTRVATRTVTFSGMPARMDVLRAGGRNRLVLSWYWVDGRLTPDAVVAKLRQTWTTLTGRRRSAAILALSAPFDERPEEALAALERMAGALPPLEVWLNSNVAEG
ncbi:exosortase A [Arenibaculum pallidiluteum]|uniref:exosortase A n=1 Tax=Arenibaculum pallidiluteum TaxID=2812559 RepID=UPI001A963721|nr:exosortase A [Arenibaculum pallidiluteum]